MKRVLIVIFILLVIIFAARALAVEVGIRGDIAGNTAYYTVVQDDNLYAVARRFDIGIVELLAANPGTDPWIPKVGTVLTITRMHVLPAVERSGIVINLPELRLFYYTADGTVMTFPIGIGREGWQTPLGVTKILRKRKQPIWVPPPSIREENPQLGEVFMPGPDNPLGEYALDLGITGLLIHGTNRPYGVGKRSSHGCIRLYPEDIAALFDKVEVGTKVTIIDAPFKLGWLEDTLYLEVTPTQQQADVIAKYRRPFSHGPFGIEEAVIKAAGEGAMIDWYAIDNAIRMHSGIPVPVAMRPQ